MRKARLLWLKNMFYALVHYPAIETFNLCNLWNLCTKPSRGSFGDEEKVNGDRSQIIWSKEFLL